jgi:alpha-tubulin suppressor-like RCC1 family protein
VTINAISTEPEAAGVVVFDGSTTDDDFLGIYSGTSTGTAVTSTGPEILVVFFGSGTTPPDPSGFTFTVETAPPPSLRRSGETHGRFSALGGLKMDAVPEPSSDHPSALQPKLGATVLACRIRARQAARATGDKAGRRTGKHASRRFAAKSATGATSAMGTHQSAQRVQRGTARTRAVLFQQINAAREKKRGVKRNATPGGAPVDHVSSLRKKPSREQVAAASAQKAHVLAQMATQARSGSTTPTMGKGVSPASMGASPPAVSAIRRPHRSRGKIAEPRERQFLRSATGGAGLRTKPAPFLRHARLLEEAEANGPAAGRSGSGEALRSGSGEEPRPVAKRWGSLAAHSGELRPDGTVKCAGPRRLRDWVPGPHPSLTAAARGRRRRATAAKSASRRSFVAAKNKGGRSAASSSSSSSSLSSSSSTAGPGRKLLQEVVVSDVNEEFLYGEQPGVGDASSHYFGNDPEELRTMLPVSFGGNTQREIMSLAVGDHACAVLDGGELWCWGRRDLYACGPVSSDPHVPVLVPLGTQAGAVSVTVVASATCVALTSGRVKCFGLSLRGHLGGDEESLGSTQSELGDALPSVDLTTTVITDVALNTFHSCFVLSGGLVKCVGEVEPYISTGALRPSEMFNHLRPTNVGALVESVAAGRTACAITRAHHRVICWGYNTNQVLGGDDASQPGSTRGAQRINIVDSETPFASVVCSIDDNRFEHKFCCAVTRARPAHGDAGGDVYCWGLHFYSPTAVAYNLFVTGGSDQMPVINWRKTAPPRVAFPHPVRELCAGTGHLCALSVEGHVHCLGYSFFSGAKQPPGGPAHVIFPTPFFNDGNLRFSHLACSEINTCAVTADTGMVLCSIGTTATNLTIDASVALAGASVVPDGAPGRDYLETENGCVMTMANGGVVFFFFFFFFFFF